MQCSHLLLFYSFEWNVLWRVLYNFMHLVIPFWISCSILILSWQTKIQRTIHTFSKHKANTKSKFYRCFVVRIQWIRAKFRIVCIYRHDYRSRCIALLTCISPHTPNSWQSDGSLRMLMLFCFIFYSFVQQTTRYTLHTLMVSRLYLVCRFVYILSGDEWMCGLRWYATEKWRESN